MKIEGLEFNSQPRKHFASDNNSPAHPKVIEAILEANKGHTLAYGDDYYTERATQRIKQVFGDSCEPFFLYIGTGANVLSLAALTRSYNAVICAQSSHVNGAECGAAEKFAGLKLYAVPTETGKIQPSEIKNYFKFFGDPHHAQPKVVSLTQSTDLGQCYTLEEVREISDLAHANGLYVHMDGARLYNACAATETSLKEMTAQAGVDVLSLGGTKNGLLGAEAVLFFRPELAKGFEYLRKQGMQLASKMRFLAVQIKTLLSDNLWLENAKAANQMAERLANELCRLSGIELTRKVETNMVYCIIPPEAIKIIRQDYLFYIFDQDRSEVRLVTNYDTTEKDVQGFIEAAQNALARI